MSEQDQLYELDWVPIPNEPYMMKYAFSDSDYNILVSNLAYIYTEKLTGFYIQERFCKLNPFAEMKSQVILENLKKSLEKCLSEKSALNMRLTENKLCITLKFPAAHVLCNYDIEMDLMTADKVMQYIISPTIFGALLSQNKVLELKKRISSESTKSSASANIFFQNMIEPEWLRGQNVPTKSILDAFFKLQTHFKELFAENEAYSLLRKEKTKKAGPVQYTSPKKKCKLQGITDDSASVTFDDTEQNISIKEENEESDQSSNTSCETLSQSIKNNGKKKKIFKI